MVKKKIQHYSPSNAAVLGYDLSLCLRKHRCLKKRKPLCWELWKSVLSKENPQRNICLPSAKFLRALSCKFLRLDNESISLSTVYRFHGPLYTCRHSTWLQTLFRLKFFTGNYTGILSELFISTLLDQYRSNSFGKTGEIEWHNRLYVDYEKQGKLSKMFWNKSKKEQIIIALKCFQ